MRKGFTLAELLIALAILGVIATFTIPKVLQNQQNGKNLSIAKEAAATVSEAYQGYKLRNAVTASTSLNDLTPYMNYVRVETASITVDHKETMSSINCTAVTCLVLHNGAVLWYDGGAGYGAFGGTATTNCMLFLLDPDGRYGGSTTGPSKAVEFALYTDGAMRTNGSLRSNSYTGAGGIGSANPSADPSWFTWN